MPSILPAIHGGMTGALLESTAIVGVTRELGVSALPKPIASAFGHFMLRPTGGADDE